MPQATMTRVGVENSRADEVGTRGLRAEHLDLSVLETASFVDAASLRGAIFSPQQVEYLAPAMAQALSIQVPD